MNTPHSVIPGSGFAFELAYLRPYRKAQRA
jgi:hypothetical protein